MTTAAQVIDIAKSQVGYREGFSGGHWNNIQKYSGEVPGLEWSNGQAWCDVFVCWCFHKAGLTNFPVAAFTGYSTSGWKARNRWSEYPAIGAQVMFGVNVHTGLVYNYDDTFIYTVEGNTNVNGSAEGDGVYLKKHARRDAYVVGYGYPEYEEGITSADPAWASHAPSGGSGAGGGVPSGTVTPPAAPVLKPVLRLSHVIAAMAMDSASNSPTGVVHYGDPAGSRALEQALWDIGINCGPVDGSLGTMFRSGYAKYQRSLGYKGRDADGIPGMTSLTKLGQRTGRFTVIA